MTFSVALFITGVALILLGLLGRVTIHEIKAGTNNRFTRLIVGVLGLVFVIGGIVKEEKLFSTPTPTPAFEPASLPNLSGIWYARTITESSNLKRYEGLELHYRLMLDQSEDDRIMVDGRKNSGNL